MERRRELWICVLLFGVTLFLYWPVIGFGFVAFDDGPYVYENPQVQAGISLAGIRWAGSAFVVANWHPLTLISLMLDRSLFGPGPAGFHLTNLLLHAANTVLVFAGLRRMTKAVWPSFLVAAWFGWHPLNVESVAWVSERKNVLSMFFGLLSLWFYARYAARKSAGPYLMALVCFGLGLAAKPMLVSWPLLLLLLDYWPLRRMAPPAVPGGEAPILRAAARLAVEKLPFAALSLAVCILTMAAQTAGHSILSLKEAPLGLRVLNILDAYVAYLAKTVWPVNLCVLYPLPAEWPVRSAVAAALVLAVISGLAFHWRRRFCWLPAGWGWYVAALLPVIGIVQTGGQAMADRHAYLPDLGVFAAVAWGIEYAAGQIPRARSWLIGACVMSLAGCLIATRAQLPYWRDSIALFSRAVSVTRNNYYIQNNLGVALSAAGRSKEAITQYEDALRSKPDDIESRYHLGQELVTVGRYHDAETNFQAVLRQMPGNVLLLNNLGVAEILAGEAGAAKENFLRAAGLQPAYPKSYYNLGLLEEKAGNHGAALTNFLTALRLDPDWPEALNCAALLQITCPDHRWRDPVSARNFSSRANQLTGGQNPAYLETLAGCQAANGDFSNAVVEVKTAVEAARAGNLPALAARLTQEINIYESGQIPTNLGIAVLPTAGPP